MRYNPRQSTPELGELLKSEGMERLVMAAAEHGAHAAAAVVQKRSTNLANSIRAEFGGRSGGNRQDRCEAFIVAGNEDVDYAADVNWGTHGQRAQHFMQAAIDAIHTPGGR